MTVLGARVMYLNFHYRIEFKQPQFLFVLLFRESG